ncbi:MAG: hypothetical protein JJD98_01720 [Polaromonas sp.]|nr:hypothetical protein [Polaromonas sp.]
MQQALSAVTQTAKALGRLHRQWVIHCDIKPANLHQSEDDVWRQLDLGVAQRPLTTPQFTLIWRDSGSGCCAPGAAAAAQTSL